LEYFEFQLNQKQMVHTLRTVRRKSVVTNARVGGVDIPNNKLIEFSLQYVYGVGRTTAKKILLNSTVENKRTKDLNEPELQRLRDEVDNYMTEGDLRRIRTLNVKRLKEIGCYRGKRHILGLPVNGQRTKTNARTLKGKRKTVAGKKIARK
jgi:small subunit ribosomal protein S13